MKNDDDVGLDPNEIKRDDDLDVDPNEIVRLNQGTKYFGYQHSQLAEKIEAGEIPQPYLLSETGRALGWTGRQIIDHHRKRVALTAKKSKR